MKAFLREEDLADPDVPKEPDLEYDSNPANPLVFATVPIPRYAVTINVPASATGKQLQVLDGKLQIVVSVAATPPACQLQLVRGTYLAQVLEVGLQSPPFAVTPTGPTNVALG
jgi:hypothetical protein